MSTLPCPACQRTLEVDADALVACPHCAKTLDIRLFTPIALHVDHAVVALPDDAICANHPAKRAEHVCAGTGAYICALCAVHTGGEVFSASYLDTAAGKKRTRQAFAPELPRPDATAGAILIAMFIPYVGMLAWVASPFLIPYGFVLLARAARLRREGDPAHARVIRPLGLWLRGIGLALFALGLVGGLIAIILAVSSRKHS